MQGRHFHFPAPVAIESPFAAAAFKENSMLAGSCKGWDDLSTFQHQTAALW